MDYLFRIGNVIHHLKLQRSANSKLGKGENILTTYHFGVEQLELDEKGTPKLSNDSTSCMDCPMSYNQGKPSCYTHNGLQRAGIIAKLKMIAKRGEIEEFDYTKFKEFVAKLSKKDIKMIRFGAYGEPVLLPIQVVSELSQLARHTGYTHQWNKPEYQLYSQYFMASTHNTFEVSIANDMGWRVFNVDILEGAVNCPASKEAGHKTVCSSCVLCNGAGGNSKKNIYILKH